VRVCISRTQCNAT